MELLKWKIRISFLWFFMGIATWRCVHFMESYVLRKVITGEIRYTSGEFFMFSLFWLIPLVMGILVVTLEGSINRWVNFVLAVIMGIFNIFHLTEHIGQPVVHQIMIVALTVVAAGLIAWLSWMLPKQEE